MICEPGSAEVGGNKAAWITQAAGTIKNQFPAVAAFVWFDCDKETDWRPNSSSSSFTAYKTMAADGYFDGGTAVSSGGTSSGTSGTTSSSGSTSSGSTSSTDTTTTTTT